MLFRVSCLLWLEFINVKIVKIKAPTIVPTMLPSPPDMLAPPITTAAGSYGIDYYYGNSV